MLPKICSASECEREATRAKQGLCEKHFYRWRRHGDPEITLTIVGDDERRFWSKVDKKSADECWEWTGSKNDGGYGAMKMRETIIGAHVYSLQLASGTKRPDGLDTCHTCDNRPCVNPKHLYWGTRQQNMDDAWDRNRMPVGSERSSAKITENDVIEIREQYAVGADVGFLADAYGLKSPTIRCIVLGYKWKQVGGPITRRRIYKKEKVA